MFPYVFHSEGKTKFHVDIKQIIKMSCLKPPKFVTFVKVDVAILLCS